MIETDKVHDVQRMVGGGKGTTRTAKRRNYAERLAEREGPVLLHLYTETSTDARDVIDSGAPDMRRQPHPIGAGHGPGPTTLPPRLD